MGYICFRACRLVCAKVVGGFCNCTWFVASAVVVTFHGQSGISLLKVHSLSSMLLKEVVVKCAKHRKYLRKAKIYHRRTFLIRIFRHLFFLLSCFFHCQ